MRIIKILLLISVLLNSLLVWQLYKKSVSQPAVLPAEPPKQETQRQEIPEPDNLLSDADAVTSPEKPGDTAEKSVAIVVHLTLESSFFTAFTRDPEISVLAEKLRLKKLGELLSAHVARNLVWQVNMKTDIYPGDTIKLVFRRISEEEKLQRSDLPDEIELLALQYTSVKKQKTFYAYYIKEAPHSFGRFYDETGDTVEKMLNNAPLSDYIQITSLLRDRRPKHDGIDFKAPVGTPVYAPFDGRVTKTNWNMRYNGYSMEAALSGGEVVMILLHCDRLAVKQGEHFKKGEIIAYVGNTGRSTAPHLHYQLQHGHGKKVKIIDPLEYHGWKRETVKKESRNLFEETKAHYDALMKKS